MKDIKTTIMKKEKCIDFILYNLYSILYLQNHEVINFLLHVERKHNCKENIYSLTFHEH